MCREDSISLNHLVSPLASSLALRRLFLRPPLRLLPPLPLIPLPLLLLPCALVLIRPGILLTCPSRLLRFIGYQIWADCIWKIWGFLVERTFGLFTPSKSQQSWRLNDLEWYAVVCSENYVERDILNCSDKKFGRVGDSAIAVLKRKRSLLRCSYWLAIEARKFCFVSQIFDVGAKGFHYFFRNPVWFITLSVE